MSEFDRKYKKTALLNGYCRDCHRLNKKLEHRRLKQAILDHYGHACACCGVNEDVFLTVDHVNNDGAKHRKEVGPTSQVYRWIKNNGFPSGFQILCYNCNHAKFLNGGSCPHVRASLTLRTV